MIEDDEPQGSSSERPYSLSFPMLFVGCLVQPAETAYQAFDRPSHALNIILSLCLFILALFGPVLYYLYAFGASSVSPSAVTSISVVLILFLIAFTLFETMLLTLFGIEISLVQVVAIATYSLNPITFALLAIYLFNYLTVGSISFYDLLFTGRIHGSDTYLRVIPYAAWILTAIVAFLLLRCIQEAGRLSTGVATGLALLSMGPVIAAFVAAVVITEIVEPGTAAIFGRLLEIYLGRLA